MNALVWLSIPLALTGCGGSVPKAEDPKAAAVVLSEDPAPAGFVPVRELSVTSGDGCGVLGSAGSFEDARALLRAAAAKLDASYVRITKSQEPPINHQCREHEYKMSGVAFRSHVSTAPVASITPPAPPASAVAIAARVCIPGATQACLGPGACQGAQACRNDATGFLPCDCGAAERPAAPAAP